MYAYYNITCAIYELLLKLELDIDENTEGLWIHQPL